jgi:ribonuclease J
MIDIARFAELGSNGVLALVADSTTWKNQGILFSESRVGEKFDQLFKGCDQRIIVTTFASNVHGCSR